MQWQTRPSSGAMVLLGLLLTAFTAAAEPEPPMNVPGIAPDAISYGRDLDNDGDPDEIDMHLEVIEVVEEVSPGETLAFWVFAPAGAGMTPVARVPSPTIRVEQGDRVRITLHNTHYFPHTIHFHGTVHPNAMDGVPEFTQMATQPGETFIYDFVAKNPGTHFYHCHVQADIHVRMGLAGMFIIEENRPNNNFAPLIVGAGEVPDPSAGVSEDYAKEYSLVYSDVDSDLHRLPLMLTDPREIEWRMHRDYDPTSALPDLFLLNGRAFPYTLQDTPIRVPPDSNALLRVLNAGERLINLHTHGHHPILKARDGIGLRDGEFISRDTFSVGAAQRIDLDLSTTADDVHASGPGVWLMHDHTERTVTNRGINPGGDLTVLAYDGYWDESVNLPKVPGDLSRYFDPAYYRGEVPVFDPKIFGATPDTYARGWTPGRDPPLPYARRMPRPALTQMPDVLGSHRAVAKRCTDPPRSTQRILVRGGTAHAREGEVYGFSPRELKLGKCQEVELVFANSDQVRHALMIPGLNPILTVEFTGKGLKKVTFVTPDEDVTLEFHCHVETHEKMGMLGRIIVGAGSDAPAHEHTAGEAHDPIGPELFIGFGTLLSVDERQGRVVIDHEEIEGFMGAMTMSFSVEPRAQLAALTPGAKVRFVIDTDKRAITDIGPAPAVD